MTRKSDLMLEQNRRQRRSIDARQDAGASDQVPAALHRFRYKSGADNHIVARLWDGTNEGTTDVKIAMDPQLQKQLVGTGYTYSDFQTRVRDSDSQAESIQPAYVLNGVVFAMQVDGGTGVSVDGDEVLWQQVCPSQHWAHQC